MANSNIQSYPELPANARQLQDDDVLLVLRNGFPYRYRVSPSSGTAAIDLVRTARTDPVEGEQSVFALPANARDNYAWFEMTARVRGNSTRSYVIPLDDLGATPIILEFAINTVTPDPVFLSARSTEIVLSGAHSNASARLRRVTSGL